MGSASIGRAIFGVTLIVFGIAAVIDRHFNAIGQAIPAGWPSGLADACALLCAAGGGALLLPRREAAAASAGVLTGYFTLWLLLGKLPFILRAPLVEVSYQSAGETAVLLAAAWTLWATLWPARPSSRWRGVLGPCGQRAARKLFALALLAFGLSHFVYLEQTAPLVPRWLPWHAGFAYATGASYLAAGAALLSGRIVRPAATLTAMQMGMFTLLVWVAPLLSCRASAEAIAEFTISATLTAAACVMTDASRATSA